nr:nuclear ribonuclease Z isoform X2 [Ipomoea trifida]
MEIKQDTCTSVSEPSPSKSKNKNKGKVLKRGLNIEGYQIEGLSIAGHETCVIIPTLNLAFDIGKCPQRAVSQQFVFISHGHMDHIGGLPMYVATRGLYRMTPQQLLCPRLLRKVLRRFLKLIELWTNLSSSIL